MNIELNEEQKKLFNNNNDGARLCHDHDCSSIGDCHHKTDHTSTQCQHSNSPHASHHHAHFQSPRKPHAKGPQQSFQLTSFLAQSQDYKYAVVLAIAYFLLSCQAFYQGVISSSVHQTEESFDCLLNSISISFIVFCGIKAKCYIKDDSYPFAMERIEYLSSFTTCLHIILLTLFHFSRNVHEILDNFEIFAPVTTAHQGGEQHSQYYLAMRLALAFMGVFLFIEYMQSGFHQHIEQEAAYNVYVEQYKALTGKRTERLFYTHYLNLHGLALLLFTELLLNLGTFLEFMLDSVIQFPAIGTLIVLCSIIIIYLQIRPLLLVTSNALLLASNEPSDQIRASLAQFGDKVDLYLYNNCNSYDCIASIESKTPEPTLREKVRSHLEPKFKRVFVHIVQTD